MHSSNHDCKQRMIPGRCLTLFSTGLFLLTACAATRSATGAEPGHKPETAGSPPVRIHLVLDDALAEKIADGLPTCFAVIAQSKLDGNALIRAVAAGESMVWIGAPQNIPKQLWVGSFRPADIPLAVQAAHNSPLQHAPLPAIRAKIYSAFLQPPNEFAKHNIDEEIRADFLPMLEAYDRFGQLVGYPGVVLSHSAPSLVGRRFAGAECFFYFFDNPAEAMEISAWKNVLSAIESRRNSRLVVESCDANFASYQPGERAQIRVRVRNLRAKAAALELRFLSQGPGQTDFTPVTSMRRVADADSDTEAVCDYLVPAAPGLHRIRVDICQDPQHAETLTVAGAPLVVDRREVGFVVIAKPLKTPKLMEIAGPNLRFDGVDGFYVGTHYYPSSSWWEWAWRDFDPVVVARDFRGMRRAANRVVRVGVDPVLDESTLRAMDAAVYLAAEQGIVLDICVFNQWVQNLGFERPTGEHVAFEFRHPRDFNIYSISLRNLALQREYVGVLANRWRDAGNVIYNLANETYIKDPDPSQMDPEARAWTGIPAENGERRDTLLFRNWAADMTQAIRQAGGEQPVFGGYLFSLSAGGDNYLANADAPLVTWHGYAPPAHLASTVQYFDPASSGRPLLLEEFGTLGWNNAAHYDAVAHRALAAGAAGAMSYEWGVSWLAKESCFVPLPIRQCMVDNPDPRWFAPAIEYVRINTSEQGVGIAPFASGFGYGSIYHGTPFAAEAALALARVGIMARHLSRRSIPELVYVVVPEARTADIAEYLATFDLLWREGVEFGVWQEAQIERLPREVRTIICPGTVSAQTKIVLDERRESGVQVFDRPGQAWLTATVLPRVTVTPPGAASVMVRRTTHGTLYSLFADKPAEQVSITAANHQVKLGLAPHGLVLVSDRGIGMIEAAGAVEIDGASYCTIDAGRTILSAENGQALTEAEHIQVMVTEPTKIHFHRTMRAVEIFVEPQVSPIGTITLREPTKTLDVDSEMSRYKLRIQFAK